MALRSPISQFSAESAVVTQQRLLVMLYDRVMRDIDDAETAIRSGDRHACNSALLHAQEIIAELERALDPTVWDAAKELATVYMYVQGRLVRANVAQDLAALESCRVALGPLREAWTKAWQVSLAPTTPSAAGHGGDFAMASAGSVVSPASASPNRVRRPLDVAG
ncbi:MAG TPA: flagellar export chaperone FliS [Microthrixaceae bacterium]|nr:flagellar export chaperone FliS [Microthrixaceae bacterium]